MQISLSAPGNLRILLQWSIFLLICEINQNLQLLQITRRHPHLHVKTLDIKFKVLHILIHEVFTQTDLFIFHYPLVQSATAHDLNAPACRGSVADTVVSAISRNDLHGLINKFLEFHLKET